MAGIVRYTALPPIAWRAIIGRMRSVVIVAVPGVQTLDVSGPAEAFSIATRFHGAAYDVRLVTPDGAPARGTSGLTLQPDSAIDDIGGAIDTLVVAGGEGVFEAAHDARLIAWLRTTSHRALRTASVCTGALLLAEAGLLDGRRATTHWAFCDELAERYPAVTVERDPIFVRDGVVATSAGVTAGMDLALALIEEDHGADTALATARSLVLFVRRPGGQSQFSTALAAQPARREPLRDLQGWILEHLDADLTVPALALRAHMSERNFARAFRAETGLTPATYVEAARVERARRELETTHLGVEAVAGRCGFGTVETMRRAFHRRLGVNPAAYRDRFAA
jgi:transcriptional regulator GlxA family with amidase domain